MKKLIILSVLIFGLAIGAIFGAKGIYDNGVSTGKQLESDELSEKIQALGTAVEEKMTMKDKISSLFKEMPETVDAEGIDQYINKLQDLTKEIKVDSMKDVMNQYLEKWEEFRDTYASEDNEAITEKFNALRTFYENMSTKFKSYYDDAIREAILGL